MSEFDQFLDIQREIAEATLKIIDKYKGEEAPKKQRTYKLNLVEDILRSAGKPLHISEIIEIAERRFNVTLERDSIVSALVKKVKVGQKFIRTAPNTFSLKKGDGHD
ncbi:conserved hypothetical protein [Desulfofarcimen acetoxidans DSM 771]|uniref:HTH HARE-type domain-containing protein n=1 Tax=Desulfofarcimen acetoxidans (strain ATCC 49208 / DSM 771 / KCTC 5769 / VKM B-1644 / 5575) TaxID=485916 RepID=C8VYM6_DESAS|nr:HTH domain-containing protein [Desulfofarcimen acetoxidans]ACV64747.1 conserved hypothetical protein [Desulfofarcimen acetoxidans DSM 771]